MTALAVPADVVTVEQLLAWVGRDLARANVAYVAEVARPPAQRRPVALTALTGVLGWPAPDTPPADVLRFAGTPGLPIAQALAAEQARPQHLQRPDLIRELAERAAAAGPNAAALSPAFDDGRHP